MSANTAENTISTEPPKLKLDLACGRVKQEGFFGVDINPNTHADLILNLEEYPWPWENNSVDEIHSAHFLEHVKDANKFMEEVWRILKPGGIAHFVTPYYTSVRAWQDPSHIRAVSEHTYRYFTEKGRKEMALEHYPNTCDFEIIKFDYNIMSPEWKGKSQEAIQYAAIHFWNVIDDLIAHLKKPEKK